MANLLSEVTQAKYIKLGDKGKWEEHCFSDGTLRLGYNEVPASFNPNTDRNIITDLYLKLGIQKSAASNHARQVIDFYNAGPETIWITFSQGRLWWAQTHKEVEYLGKDNDTGSRLKKTINGWHSSSAGNIPLMMRDLSGKLTRSANYRQTICSINKNAFAYLMNKIQDRDISEVRETKLAREHIYELTQNLIQLLTWQDFELFVDILFSASGWRRITKLGGTQKITDIELISPLTNEIAFIQVKSQTTQKELNYYAKEFQRMPADRFFYIYHSAENNLEICDRKIRLMGPRELAEGAFRSGLIDWLVEKVG